MVKKKELVDRLSKRGYTKKDSHVILDDVFATIADALAEGESVQIHGFGTFVVKTIASRETTSLSTDERITISSYRSPRFTAGKLLKDSVKLGRSTL